jgi:beta-phosphoglucomutase-like phosphatase (HAD superfamily)
MSRITHLLFDCDGTLVDSESIAMAVMQKAAMALPLPLTREDCYRLFLGHSRQHCLGLLEQHYGAPLPAEFASSLAGAIRHQLEHELQPIVGVRSMLDRLSRVKCVIESTGVV